MKKVSDGQQVGAGDVLVEADLDKIRKEGYETTTMVILTNAEEFAKIEKGEEKSVTFTDEIMRLKKA